MATTRPTKTPPPPPAPPEHDPTKTDPPESDAAAADVSWLPDGVRPVEGMDDTFVADRDVYVTRRSGSGRESAVLLLGGGQTIPGVRLRESLDRYAADSAFEIK